MLLGYSILGSVPVSDTYRIRIRTRYGTDTYPIRHVAYRLTWRIRIHQIRSPIRQIRSLIRQKRSDTRPRPRDPCEPRVDRALISLARLRPARFEPGFLPYAPKSLSTALNDYICYMLVTIIFTLYLSI